MLRLKRMPFHCLKYMMPLMPSVEVSITPLSISFPDFGKPPWKSSKQYTAFTVGTLGFFQCECMPFGLCNTLAIFQRLMTNCLGVLNYSTCLVYLNDIVIYSSTQEEHIEWLQAILERFRLHRLRLKPLKCDFFKEKIEYLGHSVSLKRVWPSRDNLKAIAKYPELMMYTTIKGFIIDASLKTLQE